MKSDGDTSGLQKALTKVNSATSSLSKELRGINTLLKFDPKNTELLAQKQAVLTENIEKTSIKLKSLESVQDQVNKKWQNYINLKPKIEEVANSIAKTENELKNLQKEQQKAQQEFEKGKITKQQYEEINNKVKECKTNLSDLKKEQKELNETTVSTEDYRAYQREIINTRNQVKQLKKEASNWTAVSKSLDNISSKMKTVGDAVSNVGNKFLGLTATIGAGVAYGVKYNSQMQKYETALETLIGSAEEANRIMKQIKEDAKTTPFDVAGLTQANQLLISTGLNGDESRKTILALGDAIAATGGGDEELSRMAVNLQQIKNTGKAAAVDIKQFAYAGIDIYGLLADYLGITKEEAASMTVTWEDLNGALIHASEEGGKYFGAMAEQSETFNGAFSNAMDSFSQSLGSLTESLMPVLTRIIQKVTEWMNKFNELDQETKDFILKIALLVAAIGPALIIVGKLITAGSAIAGTLSNITGWIAKASTGVGGFSNVLSVLTGPVGIVIAAITAFVGVLVYLYNTNEEVRTKMQEVWANIVDLFQNTVMPVINNLVNFFMSFINTIVSLIQKLWKFIEPFVTDMLNWLFDFWNNTGSKILKNVMGVVDGLIDLVTMIWNNVISPLINFLVDKLQPAFSVVFGVISSVVQTFGDTIGSIIQNVTGVLKGIIDFITGVFSGDWEKAWNGVKEIFSNIVSGLANIVKAPINAIISLINGFIKGLNNIQIPDWVPGVGGKGLNIPQIPQLAKGGIVDSATLALIGEGSASEAVIPLDRTLTKYMAEAMRQAGGSGQITVNFYPQKMTDAELNNAFNYINRRFGLQY